MKPKKKIVIHYTVEIDEKQERRILEESKNLGIDYNDAGPIETMKRFLILEGIDSLEGEMNSIEYRRIY